MPVFLEREGSFSLLFALIVIYSTWRCMGWFVNLKMRSQLIGECFGCIFDDDLRDSYSQKFGDSAFSPDRLIGK